MKAEELKIGNLYDQFGNITEVNWCTIKDLEKAPKEQLWCKPIPLTEEWLLKFGFRFFKSKKGFNNYTLWIDNEFHLSFPDFFGDPSCLAYRYKEDHPLAHKRHSVPIVLNMEYVHQLQNLYFALTGTELEMK
jgi:hypothetical protein